MKYLAILFTLLFLTFSCKKNEKVVDKCSNGYKDTGEENIDCGGTCAPCPVVYTPSVYLKVNNVPLTFPNYSIKEDNGTYFFSCNNDTISMNLNIGPVLKEDTFYVRSSYSNFVLNGVDYNIVQTGSSSFGSISEMIVDDRVLTAYFGATFFRPGSNIPVVVSSGNFLDISY